MNDFRIPVCIGKNTRQYCHEVNKTIKRGQRIFLVGKLSFKRIA